jgi:tetratricopeptide (TPR) repeat protein
LKSASGFYGKLGALLGNEKDFASRRALARANLELADLTDKVGRKEDALAAHRAVLAAREALLAEPGSDAGTKAEVGLSLTAIAKVLTSTNQTDEARTTYRRSESLLTGLAKSEPSARAVLADCRRQLGFLLWITGKPGEALEAYKLALADQEALAAALDASDDAREGLALARLSIGILLLNTGKPTDAEAEFRAALAIQQKLADLKASVLKFHSSLAYTHYLLGVVLMRMSKPSEAEFRAAWRSSKSSPMPTRPSLISADARRRLMLALVWTCKWPASRPKLRSQGARHFPEAGGRQPRRSRRPLRSWRRVH